MVWGPGRCLFTLVMPCWREGSEDTRPIDHLLSGVDVASMKSAAHASCLCIL